MTGTDNFTLTSTSDNGVTKTFDLQEHFTATQTGFADNEEGAGTGTNFTVKDLVTAINKSGVATASITDDGRLDLKANGNAELELQLDHTDGVTTTARKMAVAQAATSLAANFGFGSSVSKSATDRLPRPTPKQATPLVSLGTMVTTAGDVDTFTVN